MSRVGFKMSFPAGGMDAVTMYDDLYARILSYLAGAGFVEVLYDQADPGLEEYFYFIQAGSATTDAHDDVPRWMIGFDANGPVMLSGQTQWGDTKMSTQIAIAEDTWGFDADSEVWFAADGAAGWWWLAQLHVDVAQPTGYVLDALTVGTPIRRYIADRQSGIVARYGLLEIKSAIKRWFPPYAMGADGIEQQAASLTGTPFFELFSPLGGSNLLAMRHTGSPLSQLVAPIFPVMPATPALSAALLGELEAIMQITDGHALGATVAPGWIALITGNPATTSAFALPAPDSFTIFP
jgi:hypothetical protein